MLKILNFTLFNTSLTFCSCVSCLYSYAFYSSFTSRLIYSTSLLNLRRSCSNLYAFALYFKKWVWERLNLETNFTLFIPKLHELFISFIWKSLWTCTCIYVQQQIEECSFVFVIKFTIMHCIICKCVCL